MKHIIKWFLRALFVLFLFTTVKAEPYNEFTIKPLLPSFQSEYITGYYDLDLREKESETIYLEVKNEGHHPAKVSIKLYNAATGINAKAEYQKDIESKVTSIKDIVHVVKEIHVDAFEKVHVPLDIKLPKTNGLPLYIGSIELKADTIESDPKDETSTAVKNRVMYIIPIKIRSFEQEMKSNIKYIETRYDKNILKTTLENDQAIHMGNVKIKGEVIDHETKDVVGTLEINSGEILPNTSFELHYNLEEDLKNQHQYKLKIKVIGKEDSWEFFEDFSLNIPEDLDVVKEEKMSSILIFIPIILILYIYQKKSRSD